MEGQRNFVTNFQSLDRSKKNSDSCQASRNSKNERFLSLDIDHCEIQMDPGNPSNVQTIYI